MKPTGACYARMLAAKRALYRARRAAGLCVNCPKTRAAADAVPGHSRCRRCLLYGNRATAKRVRRLLRAGLCPVCGKKPPEPGRWACIDCRIRQSERDSQRNRQRKRGQP